MKASPFDKGAMQLLQNPFDKGWSIIFLALNPFSKGWLFHWPHSFVKSWGIATATSPFVKGWKATGSGSCCTPLVQQKLVGSLPEMPMPCCVLVVPGVQGIGVWVALFHTLFDDLWAVIKNVWDWVLLAVGCFSFWAALFPGESHLLKELEQILILQFLQGLFSPFLATVGQQDEVVTLLLQQLQSISVLPVHSFIVTFWQGIVPVYGNPLAGLLFGDPPAPITHPFVGIGLGSGILLARLLFPFGLWAWGARWCQRNPLGSLLLLHLLLAAWPQHFLLLLLARCSLLFLLLLTRCSFLLNLFLLLLLTRCSILHLFLLLFLARCSILHLGFLLLLARCRCHFHPCFFLLLLARCRPLCLLRLLLLLLARCSFPTAAAGCSPTSHHWLFCCCFWASLAFCLSSSVVAKAKSLSLSAQAFWYLSFLAWLTVPLPACLPLLFLLAAIATLLPRVNYQPKGRHPFVKVVQPPH